MFIDNQLGAVIIGHAVTTQTRIGGTIAQLGTIDQHFFIAHFDDVTRHANKALDQPHTILRRSESDDIATLRIGDMREHDIGKRQLDVIGQTIGEDTVADQQGRIHRRRWHTVPVGHGAADQQHAQQETQKSLVGGNQGLGDLFNPFHPLRLVCHYLQFHKKRPTEQAGRHECLRHQIITAYSGAYYQPRAHSAYFLLELSSRLLRGLSVCLLLLSLLLSLLLLLALSLLPPFSRSARSRSRFSRRSVRSSLPASGSASGLASSTTGGGSGATVEMPLAAMYSCMSFQPAKIPALSA